MPQKLYVAQVEHCVNDARGFENLMLLVSYVGFYHKKVNHLDIAIQSSWN